MNSIISYSADGASTTIQYPGPPDTCPVCHRGIQAQSTADSRGYIGVLSNEFRLQIPFRCPLRNCGVLFIQEYRSIQITGTSYYEPSRQYPTTIKPPIFAEGVAATSSNYVKTYTQALKADADGLDEIAGIGFRKALEFLIKDYCISKDPTTEAQIRAKFLANCIREDVTDENIKECARMAVWLGNDESHYERTWTDHDVEDLKVLIKLTEAWISNEFLTQKYRAQIQKGKEPAKTVPLLPSPVIALPK